LIKNPIELGPYTRPIDRGSDAGPIPLGSSVMTQAPGVPKWGAGVGHGSEAQAPHGAGVCPTLRHDPAPRVRWCLPSPQVAAEAPRVSTWFFFDSNNNFLKFINDDDNNNNNNNNNNNF